MANDPDREMARLWQAQPREEHTMSLAEIRAKAERFEAKTRRWNRVGGASIVVLVIANAVEVLWPGQDILERTGDLLTIAALLYVAYEYRKRGRMASMPEGLALTSCIDFHRAQLASQRDLSRQSARYLLPFVPGVTLSLLGGAFQGMPTPRLVAVAAFGVALFLGVAWVNARTARKLQQEIESLE
jgi:hypothetical protein